MAEICLSVGFKLVIVIMPRELCIAVCAEENPASERFHEQGQNIERERETSSL